MSRKLLVYLCLVALALSSAPLAIGQETKPSENPPLVGHPGPFTSSLAEPIPTDLAGQRSGSRGGPINIIYDNGVVNAAPTASSFTYGNQFNSASGDPVTNFSVTMISAFIVAGAGSDNVFVTVFGPVNTMGSASVFGSPSLALTAGSGAFNSFNVGPYAGAGSFLAGIWYVAGDTVGLGTGTNASQGFHGMVINDIDGTGFTTLPGINALVGATTTFIPVELMDFKVTDE